MKRTEKASKAASKVTKTVKTATTKPQQLRTLNVVLAVVYLLEAILLAVFNKGTSWPILSNHLTSDPIAVSAGSQTGLVVASHTLFNLNPAYVAIIWLVFSAFILALVATKARKTYEKGLATRVNAYRWLQAGVSGTLVILVIGMAVGLRDISSLLLLLAVGIIMHTVGYSLERQKQAVNQDDSLLAYGVLAGGVTWLAIGAYAWSTVIYGQQALSGYLYALLAVLLVSCTVFAALLYLSLRNKGRWADYYRTEKLFILLAFLSQSVIAWLLLAAK